MKSIPSSLLPSDTSLDIKMHQIMLQPGWAVQIESMVTLPFKNIKNLLHKNGVYCSTLTTVK
jgi:hypothetical protein